MYHSIEISGRNTWDYWHLIPPARPVVNPPEVKTQIMEIPGRNGFIDLSELLTGDVVYGSRQGSWAFIAHPDYHDTEPWNMKYQSIAQFLHGRTHTVILEDDPEYYYEGRLKVNQWAPGNNWSSVTIDYTLMPFKKEILSSDEPWLWDPFSFITGIIRSYSGIVVNGSPVTIEIKTGAETIVPTIHTTSGSSSVQFNGITHSLSIGDNVIPTIRLTNGINTLTFTGNDSITIKFRGGWL